MADDPIHPELTFEQRMELDDELYSAAIDLMPRLDDPQSDAETRRGVTRATAFLERAIALRPENWNAMWALGSAWQLLGDHERAYTAFERAYALDLPDPNVGRELAGECIALGKGGEAVAVARKTCALDPSDTGLIANLALAYLIDGQIEAARTTADDARTRDPSDPVTENLVRLVEAVATRQIAAPTRSPQ